jgi:hypothetical protein
MTMLAEPVVSNGGLILKFGLKFGTALLIVLAVTLVLVHAEVFFSPQLVIPDVIRLLISSRLLLMLARADEVIE